jgi:hypothetical protein
MLDEIAGRVVSGALFGIGAGLVMRVVQGNPKRDENNADQQAQRESMLRPIAKNAMKGIIVVSESVRGVLSEAREGVEDLYAEAQSEARGGAQRTEQPAQSNSQGNIPVQA